jgi:hypothetical protein
MARMRLLEKFLGVLVAEGNQKVDKYWNTN